MLDMLIGYSCIQIRISLLLSLLLLALHEPSGADHVNRKDQGYIDVIFFSFFSELCWGKAIVAYTMPLGLRENDYISLQKVNDSLLVNGT